MDDQQEQQQEASDPADDGQPAAPAATHPPAPAPRGPTKYRGVTQLTRSNPPRWFVRLRRYDKHHTLGTFSDQKQAAEVYDAGVYVLQKGVPQGVNFPAHWQGLTRAQGRALAVERLGEARVAALHAAALEALPPQNQAAVIVSEQAQVSAQSLQQALASANAAAAPSKPASASRQQTPRAASPAPTDAAAAAQPPAAAAARPPKGDAAGAAPPRPAAPPAGRVLRQRKAPQQQQQRRRRRGGRGSDDEGESGSSSSSEGEGSDTESDDWRPGQQKKGRRKQEDEEDEDEEDEEDDDDDGDANASDEDWQARSGSKRKQTPAKRKPATRGRATARAPAATNGPAQPQAKPQAAAADGADELPSGAGEEQQQPPEEEDEEDDGAPFVPKPKHGASEHSFRYVYKHTDSLLGTSNKCWYGKTRGERRALVTNRFVTAEEAARAVDRYLYKTRGPEACNFPVSPELAAELDGLTLAQIQEQFRMQRTYGVAKPTKNASSASQFRCVNHSSKQTWTAHAKKWGKTVFLLSAPTEEKAAHAADAGAVILRGSTLYLNFPERYANLSKEQVRALAVQDIGEAKVAQLEGMREAQLNKGRAVPAASLAPYRKPGRPKKGERRGAGKDDEESGGGGGGGSGRRPAKRTRVVGSVDEEATESVSDGAGWEQRGPDLELQVEVPLLEGEEQGGGAGAGGAAALRLQQEEGGLDGGGGGAAAGVEVVLLPGAMEVEEAEDASAPWASRAFGAQVQRVITEDMVNDAWVEVWQQVFADQAAFSQAADTGEGSAPHPAVAQGAAREAGLGEAFRSQGAVEAAWRAALAAADAQARGGDAKLREPSLHRLTFLLAYSTLWLRQADGLHQPT